MAKKFSRRQLSRYVGDGLLGGESSTKLLKQLAAYLIETRRTKEAQLIVRDIELYLADKGHLQVTTTSAFELSSALEKQIKSFVKSETNATNISLHSTIDPTVLGGVKLSLPGYELDQTTAHQLTVLRTRYRKV